MEINSNMPLIPIIVAGVAGLLTLIYGQKAFYRNLWSTAGSIIAFLFIISMVPGALQGKIYLARAADLIPGLSITFRADSLGLLFAVVSSSMWVFVNIYTIGYMEHEQHKQRFFAFFALSLFSAFGIALAENLFTLLIFYEALSLFTYPLVMHIGTPEAMKAGSKYLIYTLGGGGFLLIAIIITYFISGNLTLSQPGLFSITDGAGLLRVLFFIYLVGFGVKAAVMPIHHWLPTAMIAPTPVSTLLHAVAVVKAGVFGVLRLVYNIYGVDLLKELGLGTILAWIAAFTILVGSLVAIRQDNLKRRLAYSTISQLSYIILGGALLAPAAGLGALIHIANHAFTKGTLFMCAGIIAHETGKKNVSEMRGIGRRVPLTMAAFTIASFGMMGTPPLAGFVSKWFIGWGALQSQQPIFIAILITSALLNAIYFLPVSYTAFFDKPAKGEKWEPVSGSETTLTMLVPILGTAVATFILGIFAGVPGLPVSIAKLAVAFLFKS